MPNLVAEKIFEYAVVVDQDGKIIHNAMQQDDPIIHRKYDDGLIHLLSSKTGKLIVAPFDPETAEKMHCPHCNGVLG